MRIHAHRNTTKYERDIGSMWRRARGILPAQEFNMYSIMKAKTQLWRKRAEMEEELRSTDSWLKNDAGTTLTAATGEITGNLFHDAGATTSLDSFIEHDGYCDVANLWWLAREDAPPARQIHTRLAGQANEIAFPATVSRSDYEHVLRRIRDHN